MQSLLLVRQCRHPAVHRMRLYIWIHPSHPPFWFEHSKLLLVKKNMDMYERIAFIKSSHVLGSCDKSRIFLIPKRREGGWGGVCGNFFFLDKTRFISYLTINQSQKLKLIFFHIFLTALGEGGGTVKQSWNFSKWKVVQKWKEMRKYAKKLCYSRK